MEIHKFEIFLSLASTLNYSETAVKMYTTQSNISKQILALEKDLGVSLFVRAHRKINLTPAENILIPYARKLLHDYEAMQIKLEDYKDEQNLTLQLRTIPTMPNYLSFTYVSEFFQKHPEVHLILKEEESNRLLTSLRQDQCDLIFARTFNFVEDGFERIVTERDKFVAVLPSSHPLAKEKQLDIKQLSTERFLLLGPTTKLLKPVIELCRRAGFEPNITYQGTRVDLLMGMVEKGMGISIVMKKIANSFDSKKLVEVPLVNTIDNQLSFIRKIGAHSHASNIFWDFLKTKTKR